MKSVLYSSPFVPAEWITAHGFQPLRLVPGEQKGLHRAESAEGICPFVERFLDEAAQVENCAAVCFTTNCDQMRRAPEWLYGDHLPPSFLMHVPSTWKSIPAQKLYSSELIRLSDFLSRLGGVPPSEKKLLEVMENYERQRRILRDIKGCISSRDYSEAIMRFNRSGEVVQARRVTEISKGGIPVALLGGPLTAQDLSLFDMVRDAGGVVVLDGTETGDRTLPRPLELRSMCENPYMELIDAYFGSIPDVFRRPNSELYLWMKREFRENDVRGVILVRYVWCDLWKGEIGRIQEWLNIPLLDFDMGGENPVLRNRTRIQAFLEVLQ